jgi:hypothetical protein
MAKSLLVISGRVLQLMHKPCTPGGLSNTKKKTLEVLLRVLKSPNSNLHILCFEDLLVGQLDDALGAGERIQFFFTSY